MRFTAPGNASDAVPWEADVILPPGFDIVVEHADDLELGDDAIEIYRVADDARIAVVPTVARGVEHDGECAHAHLVYALRELDIGDHVAVHRRAAGAGKAVEQDDMPAWSSYDGDEALVFTFCVWDNSGMISPCS